MLLSMFKQVKIGLLTTSVPFDPSLDPDLYLPLRAVENFSAKEMSMIRVEHQLWLCQVELWTGYSLLQYKRLSVGLMCKVP
ncbi:hypothetical protein NC653_034127 [Populus alba x Populus x berolinensis]|uniref:Uncharacterized protein n=1 Tax=Populus alba x Populus x berolinensis TaxID=444605 RepID=A0AAD6PXF6_9ROSI|nr:hypothetical protein NC653_034127 [Populus alba x Populus x berolinensis]